MDGIEKGYSFSDDSQDSNPNQSVPAQRRMRGNCCMIFPSLYAHFYRSESVGENKCNQGEYDVSVSTGGDGIKEGFLLRFTGVWGWKHRALI